MEKIHYKEVLGGFEISSYARVYQKSDYLVKKICIYCGNYEFKECIESEKYEGGFIYNADETGRSLRPKTLASGFEKGASGSKLSKKKNKRLSWMEMQQETIDCNCS